MEFATLATVRASSSRLPNKCFLPLTNINLLEHVLLRAKKGGLNPIVCTSTHTSDNEIIKIAQNLKLQSFRGSLENKLQRWARCSQSSEFEIFHLLDCDDPFFDVDEIKLSASLLEKNKLDMVHTSNRSDSGFASVGISITKSFLLELESRANYLNSNDFDVIPWKILIQGTDKIMKMKDNVIFENDDKFRLTVDYLEDYWVIKILHHQLGTHASRFEVESLLRDHPTLALLNFFRNQDFLQNKKLKLDFNFGIK